MRGNFDCKTAAAVLGCHPNKVPQSLDPAITKLAKLMRVDPLGTIDMIRSAMDRLEPMTDQEIFIRESILRGTFDSRKS